MATPSTPVRATAQELILGPEIGRGAFGTVYKATYENETVAVKRLRSVHSKQDNGVSQDAYREMYILHNLLKADTKQDSDNIIKLHKVFISRDNAKDIKQPVVPATSSSSSRKHPPVKAVHQQTLPSVVELVYEYASHVLHGLIANQPASLSKPAVLYQLLRGVDCLHRNFLMHRDLKPCNILVTEKGVLKICDFGLARSFLAPLRDLTLDGRVVTLWYRAPELLLGHVNYTQSIDLWSIGCIFAELYLHTPLFQTKKSEADLQLLHILKITGLPHDKDKRSRLFAKFPSLREANKLQNSNFAERDIMRRLLTEIGDLGMDLLHKLLCINPDERITANEALHHPYFRTLSEKQKRNVFICED